MPAMTFTEADLAYLSANYLTLEESVPTVPSRRRRCGG
jgi:hypothetical protein